MACPSRAAAASGWQQLLVKQVFAMQIKFGKRSPEVHIDTETA
jgi:hypothetical protein